MSKKEWIGLGLFLILVGWYVQHDPILRVLGILALGIGVWYAEKK